MRVLAEAGKVRDVDSECAIPAGDARHAGEPQPYAVRAMHLAGLVEEGAVATCFESNPDGLQRTVSICEVHVKWYLPCQ